MIKIKVGQIWKYINKSDDQFTDNAWIKVFEINENKNQAAYIYTRSELNEPAFNENSKDLFDVDALEVFLNDNYKLLQDAQIEFVPLYKNNKLKSIE